MNTTTETKCIIARALRSSFCAKQKDLLTDTWMSDKMVLEAVRTMQAEWIEFDRVVDEIKAENESLYNVEILGLDS